MVTNQLKWHHLDRWYVPKPSYLISFDHFLSLSPVRFQFPDFRTMFEVIRVRSALAVCPGIPCRRLVYVAPGNSPKKQLDPKSKEETAKTAGYWNLTRDRDGKWLKLIKYDVSGTSHYDKWWEINWNNTIYHSGTSQKHHIWSVLITFYPYPR